MVLTELLAVVDAEAVRKASSGAEADVKLSRYLLVHKTLMYQSARMKGSVTFTIALSYSWSTLLVVIRL